MTLGLRNSLAMLEENGKEEILKLLITCRQETSNFFDRNIPPGMKEAIHIFLPWHLCFIQTYVYMQLVSITSGITRLQKHFTHRELYWFTFPWDLVQISASIHSTALSYKDIFSTTFFTISRYPGTRRLIQQTMIVAEWFSMFYGEEQ